MSLFFDRRLRALNSDVRFSNASDAALNDVQYHLTCCVNMKRQAEPASINIQEIVDIERVLAGIEIVHTV